MGLDIDVSPQLTETLRLYPDTFHFVIADVRKKKSLEKALAETRSVFSTPSVLINNAAIDSPPDAPPEENGPFEHYPESSWDKTLDVNLKGAFLCCQVFGSEMARSKEGSIINIASIYGLVSPDQGLYEYRRKRGEVFFKPVAYSASKSGLMNLTRYLAVYWANQNVRVNSLTIAGVLNNQEQSFIDAYTARMPVGRMAEPDEYNGSVLFLASKASAYMTGQNLVVDGGWTAI